jgi:hypothetical protein
MATVKALNDASLLSLSGVRQTRWALVFVGRSSGHAKAMNPLRYRYNENKLARKVVITNIEGRRELRKSLCFYSC